LLDKDPALRRNAIRALPANEAGRQLFFSSPVIQDPDLLTREVAFVKLAEFPTIPEIQTVVAQLARIPANTSDSYLNDAVTLLGRIHKVSGVGENEVKVAAGDPKRGEDLFFKSPTAACATCHTVAGKGGVIGPILDGIAVRNDKDYIVQSLMEPNAKLAKGFEALGVSPMPPVGLLLKEQENDRMGVETELQQKQVKIAELEAEAIKARQIKQAEGEARVHVLQAKGEADAMQYTLPLKEKQIQQSKLEAAARKEATIQNAEAAAQAKVIDSKAETERRKLLAEAEADRIRVTAAADAERMRSEGVILKQNPLLINKIVAERLSDKLQIMMVPADGKFFFANDVLHSMNMANQASQSEQGEAQPH